MAFLDTILQAVQKIPLKAKARIQLTAGSRQSLRRGTGSEFDQIRAYVEGDVAKHINWRATAKTGRTLVNSFYDDLDISLLLAVDYSASMDFGSHKMTKKALAAEIAATIAYSTLSSNDKIGLVGFDSEILDAIKPGKQKGLQRIIPESILLGSGKSGVDYIKVVDYISGLCRYPTITFLMSDFITEDYESLATALSHLRLRNNPVIIETIDPVELTPPEGMGRMRYRDIETGQQFVYNMTKKNREAVIKFNKERREKLHDLFNSLKIPFITVIPEDNYVPELRQLFTMGRGRV